MDIIEEVDGLELIPNMAENGYDRNALVSQQEPSASQWASARFCDHRHQSEHNDGARRAAEDQEHERGTVLGTR